MGQSITWILFLFCLMCLTAIELCIRFESKAGEVFNYNHYTYEEVPTEAEDKDGPKSKLMLMLEQKMKENYERMK